MSPLLILVAWLAAAAVAYGVIFGSMDRGLGSVRHAMRRPNRAFAVLLAIVWPIGLPIFLAIEGYGGWRYRHRCGPDCPVTDAAAKAFALALRGLGPPTPLPKALVAGPTIAYRRWAVYTDGRVLWLGSLGHPALWTPGHPLQAACFVPIPSIPDVIGHMRVGGMGPQLHCRCGIYAMKRAADVDDGGYMSGGLQSGAYAILANVNGAVALGPRHRARPRLPRAVRLPGAALAPQAGAAGPARLSGRRPGRAGGRRRALRGAGGGDAMTPPCYSCRMLRQHCGYCRCCD